jgi:hypothetical protein
MKHINKKERLRKMIIIDKFLKSFQKYPLFNTKRITTTIKKKKKR